MKRENKKEIYSIRKFKIGVGSAVIGLSFLGAYGSLQQAPILNDLIGVKTVYADDSNFNRTETGTVDAGGSTTVNKLVPSEEVKAVPNGEKNFNATVAFTTEAGLGSGTLVADDTIVTVAHNFVHLDETTNPISVKENVNKSGDVHVATLPDGKQVRFSNDDVHYWNKEGFVQGYKNDLAVVKLKKAYENEQLAEVVDRTEVPADNSTIHVFGYPQGKLQPILNEKVASTENYGSNIYGIAYQGSKPGASGGGIYNAEGKLIGVNQNGVVDKRSGGIVFSKEQLDWIKSYINKNPIQPVYLKADQAVSDKEYEFKEDKIKVTEKSSGDSYEVQTVPYLIVNETPDMKIDQDPGLVNALNKVKGNSEREVQGRKDIQDLMGRKTGVVFKVRSYEEDGSEGWRYFRTWTSMDTSIVQGETKIPYYAYESLKESLGDSIDYSSDNTIDYGKATGESIGGENSNNITMVVWTLPEPEQPGEDPWPGVPDFATSGRGNAATLYERYEGDDEKRDSNGHLLDDTLSYVHIGTKPETLEEVAETKKTKYIKNTELLKLGLTERVLKEGADKKKVTKKTYVLNKNEDKRDETRGYKVGEFTTAGTTAPSVENGGVTLKEEVSYTTLENKVIEVAAPEDKTVVEKLPFTTRYEKDSEREKGQPDITATEGKNGSKTTVTTYEVNEDTGKVTETVHDPVVVQPVEKVVKVAAKDKVELVKNGTKTIERTTRYEVDPKTGKVTETVTDKLISDTSNEPPVVEKPAFDESKIKVVTEELQPTVRYEKDDSREKGQPNITVPGEVGQKKITTVPLPDENGIEKDVVTEEVVKPAGETVIKVATKTKVERIKDGTRTIERTTSYEVDPKTGKITETVTDKLISDMSTEPPVVDIPEFNGGVSPIEPPVVDVLEFDLSKLPKEDKPAPALRDFNLGTGKNDFGPKKESPKVEVVPADFTTPRTEEVPSEKKADAPKVEAVSQTGNTSTGAQAATTKASKGELPYTGTVENTALTLAGISLAGLSLAVMGIGLNKKKENQ